MTRYRQLETERLVLRALENSDWESISFLRSDEEVNRFVRRPRADTREEALAFIHRIRAFAADDSSYYWSISLRDDREMIGSICLWNFSPDRKTAEIGYDLKPAFQRQGIMTEAIRAVLDFGFGDLELERIDAFTNTRNESSRRVLEHNRFQLNPARNDEEEPENVIYEIYRQP